MSEAALILALDAHSVLEGLGYPPSSGSVKWIGDRPELRTGPGSQGHRVAVPLMGHPFGHASTHYHVCLSPEEATLCLLLLLASANHGLEAAAFGLGREGRRQAAKVMMGLLPHDRMLLGRFTFRGAEEERDE